MEPAIELRRSWRRVPSEFGVLVVVAMVAMVVGVATDAREVRREVGPSNREGMCICRGLPRFLAALELALFGWSR